MMSGRNGGAWPTGLAAWAAVALLASAVSAGTDPRNRGCAARSRAGGRAAAAALEPGAIIANGTVSLGVNAAGHLNVEMGEPDPLGIGYVGLRYIATGAASTEPGCLCEGWGVAAHDPSSASGAIVGYANEDDGIVNVAVESFVASASSATSTVLVGGDPPALRVSHQYRPSAATAHLYEVRVRIENVSGAPAGIKYRRVMDWDVFPTPFEEFVTIQQGTSPYLVATTNDGFDTADPTRGPTHLGFTGSFVDAGPFDHGANFTFDFGVLPPSGAVEFLTYYGAAGTEADALAAIAAVGVEAYSFGQPSTPTGATLGEPNTFVFAFGGIGGGTVTPPALRELVPDRGGSCGPVTVVGMGSRFKPGATFALKREGRPDVVASAVSVASDGFSIQGTFDLNGVEAGVWDAEVVNPDDGSPETVETASLPGAFTVEACRRACVDVDIVGPGRIGVNRRAVFSAAMTNLGNVDAAAVRVSVRGIPADVAVEIVSADPPATPVAGGIDVTVPLLPPDVTRYVQFALTAPPPVPRAFDVQAAGMPPCGKSKRLHVEVLGSVDPNAKNGTPGFGAAGFVTGTEPLSYAIQFMNAEDASAPAQEVVLTDQLDVTRVDLTSLSLGPIGFAGTTIPILPGQGEFTHPGVPVDIAEDLNGNGNLLDDDILVTIAVHLGTEPTAEDYGRLTWELRSVDPTTGELPADPRRGFVPPGAEGEVLFTLSALPDLATGDEIRDQASIVFDLNEAILPPPWLNTVDKTPPESLVTPLPGTVSAAAFLVEWQGADVGAGVASFDVFVSVDGGAPTAFLTDTTVTAAEFTGESGHRYGFFTRARDNVGNVEDPPATPDAITTVEIPTTTSSSSTSSTSSSSSSTTTTSTSSTTTTTLVCSSARCLIEAALGSSACAGQRIPPGIRHDLETAMSSIEEASSRPDRAERLLKRARRNLTLAATAAGRATKGPAPRLAPECAAAIQDAAATVRSGLEP